MITVQAPATSVVALAEPVAQDPGEAERTTPRELDRYPRPPGVHPWPRLRHRSGASWSVAGMVRDVLPTRRLPLVLGVGALLVVGVIDPPAALGAGLAYEALRRWSAAATA